MSQEIPVGPHTKQLMARVMAEGNESPTFTQEEKMALVADGLMDPHEVGLTSAEEAHLELAPEEKKAPVLGPEMIFRCGCIPLELRAEWDYKDTKIILAPADKADWVADWMEKNKNTFRIQGQMNCGTLGVAMERTFKDPVLGMVQLLIVAAEALEAFYTKTELPKLSDQAEPPATSQAYEAAPITDEPVLS